MILSNLKEHNLFDTGNHFKIATITVDAERELENTLYIIFASISVLLNWLSFLLKVVVPVL